MKPHDEFTCIVCPRGCRLTIDGNLQVVGARCSKGLTWAKQELSSPERTVCTSMLVSNGERLLVSVITDRPVPMESMRSVVDSIREITVEAPVARHQVLIKNPGGTQCAVIATQTVARKASKDVD